ncbi:MAG: 16S rRNA (adenine(1518)-N(6)/adenine(1519)-N(6))-dimethyltransferase RsmA [Synergistaceae bacterium]|jgi:16S rRNA (adenine1518-N6/adenine1519-N6)-dimethyltransferase|nr:16S rRNA (adenine(1518)-N(6)/adenine(1519)-N(6))-dimethyltransferase RsmA [Synergistaceae bacterium]
MPFRYNTDIGQNFLIDGSVVEWMTARANLNSSDSVLEIGAGGGMLTKGLIASGAARVEAVELDTRLREYLEPIAASNPSLSLHWGDAVKFDYAGLPAVTRIIANIPYHITTPLVWRLLEAYSGSAMDYMLLMVQAEAASRLSCGAGSRMSNPLSVTIAAMGHTSTVRKVPRSSFRPAPRVDSAIVEITLSGFGTSTELPRDRMWRRMISGSFAARRKTLANNWAISFRVPKARGEEILAAHALAPTARPEELSLSDWTALREDDALAANIRNEGRNEGV